MFRTKACIWCGGTKMSAEDVIPRWIGRTLRKEVVPPGEQLWLSVHRKMPHDESKSLRHHRKIGAASGPRRRVVCDTCNRGWMKNLEDAVKPVIENMILGRVPKGGISLTESDIDIICRWVTKTSLINYFVGGPACDPGVYHAFYKSQKPSPYSRIWLTAHFPEWGELMKVWPTPLGRHRSNGGPQLILFTAYIGWFAFQLVMDVQIESPSLPSGRNIPDPVCFELWPTVERRSWPPDMAMTSAAMEYFAENKIGPPAT